MSSPAVTKIDDQWLIENLKCAQRRVVFMGPGMATIVADAICEAWERLGPGSVSIILDIDPEVCRMGYGEIEATKRLHSKAKTMGAAIQSHEGIRICLLIVDDKTYIYSPTPQLVEAGPKRPDQPNAIVLDFVPQPVADDLGVGEQGKDGQTVGTDNISPEKLLDVSNDLVRNPPLKFDVAQKVRVFNSQLEFVEFELRGFQIGRKKVPIPNDLLGLASDQKTEKLLHSSFQLIDEEDSSISGEKIRKMKDEIVKNYLMSIPRYGNVIKRSIKDAFLKEIKKLEKEIETFKANITENLDAAIERNKQSLVKTLMPQLVNQPPKKWMKYLGDSRDEEAIRKLLIRELDKAFSSTGAIFGDMKINVMFKGITYETLTSEEFVAAAREELPEEFDLFVEYDAAKAADKGQQSLW